MTSIVSGRLTAAPVTSTPGLDALPSGIRTAMLDCIQVNLAVLADHWHGAGTHLRLGAALRLRCRPAACSGLPTVEATVTEQLSADGPLLGLTVADRRDGVAAWDLVTALADGDDDMPPAGATAARPGYVVADAWHLPWTPYHRQRHMPHSFLVSLAPSGQLRILDAYHTDTAWGQARPGQWLLTPAELAAALPGGADTAIWFTPSPPQPVRPVIDLTGADAYVEAYRQAANRVTALDQLCLETWLLERSRLLHAAFLASQGSPTGTSIAAHLAAWRQVTEEVYLAFRRAERHRPEPPGLLERIADLLRADGAVFAGEPPQAADERADGYADATAPAAPGVPPGRAAEDRLWLPFTETVAHVLRVSPPVIGGASSLAALPAWNSLRLVETIEALENRFGVRFQPGDLVPELMQDIGYLFGLVREAATPARAAAAESMSPVAATAESIS